MTVYRRGEETRVGETPWRGVAATVRLASAVARGVALAAPECVDRLAAGRVAVAVDDGRGTSAATADEPSCVGVASIVGDSVGVDDGRRVSVTVGLGVAVGVGDGDGDGVSVALPDVDASTWPGSAIPGGGAACAIAMCRSRGATTIEASPRK